MGTQAGLNAKETLLLRVGVVFDMFEMGLPKEKEID